MTQIRAGPHVGEVELHGQDLGGEHRQAGGSRGVLDPLPAPQADVTVTWGRPRVLVVGGHHGLSRSALIADGIGYNPASNRWSPLPTAPVRDRTNHLAIWTGTQMLIWGGKSVQSKLY